MKSIQYHCHIAQNAGRAALRCGYFASELLQFGYNFKKTPRKRLKKVDNPAGLGYIIIVVVCVIDRTNYREITE